MEGGNAAGGGGGGGATALVLIIANSLAFTGPVRVPIALLAVPPTTPPEFIIIHIWFFSRKIF